MVAGALVTLGVAVGGARGEAREDWALTLLRGMSLEEKVGQVMVGFFRGAELSGDLRDSLRRVRLGGVILYSSTGNIESPGQVARLVRDIQNFSARGGLVPPWVAIDQEGGVVSRLVDGVTVFPGNMALGATGDGVLAEAQGRIEAQELRTLGITWNFAPVVDVNNNPANPVIGIRSFGSSPEEVARLGAALGRPHYAAGVLWTAKHYPGHGDTDTDSHLGLPRISGDLARLERVELAPFDALIREGVPAIMTAHVVVPALESGDSLPATMSPAVLGRLRRQGFDGLIVSDSLGMGALDKTWGTPEAAVRALEAGCDVLVFGADKGHDPEEQREIAQALIRAVRQGRIPEKRLDDAVLRVLRAKARLGIVKDPWPREGDLPLLAAPESLAVADRIAQKSITLVRGGVLGPDERGEGSVPLVWPSDRRKAAEVLVEACPALAPIFMSRDASPEERDEVIRRVGDAPRVVVGGYDLGRAPAWQALVREVGPARVTLLALRSPYDLMALPAVGGYLCSYGDRPVSLRALGAVLMGRGVPQGRLPVELPGLYPRGWGMGE